jgi:hypothetical protein
MSDSLANILYLSALPISGARSRSSSASLVVGDSIEDGKHAGLKSDRPHTPPFTIRAEAESLSPILSFKARRRRAAKLANFFGVGYHDLSESMGLTVATPMRFPGELAESRTNPPVTFALPSSSVEVDIKMSGRGSGRFWSMADGRRNMEDANMDDVIGRLRELKAR